MLTYLLEYSGKKSQKSKDVIARGEGIGHTHNDQRQVTEEKNRFATKFVGQSWADHSTKRHADNEYCLCEVLEISTVTHQVPLQVPPLHVQYKCE